MTLEELRKEAEKAKKQGVKLLLRIPKEQHLRRFPRGVLLEEQEDYKVYSFDPNKILRWVKKNQKKLEKNKADSIKHIQKELKRTLLKQLELSDTILVELYWENKAPKLVIRDRYHRWKNTVEYRPGMPKYDDMVEIMLKAMNLHVDISFSVINGENVKVRWLGGWIDKRYGRVVGETVDAKSVAHTD